MSKSGRNNRSNNKGANNKTQNQNRSKGFKPTSKPGQPRKDSDDPRVNYDNTREDKFERDIARDSKKSNANDIAELSRNAELMKAAASIPFGSIIGTPVDGYKADAVPGILAFHWSPNYGISDTTVINKAFQQIYSYIVHANSRNYKYEYTDLAMYCIAGMEVFVAIEEMKRAFGLMRGYSEKNAYYVDALVTAAGFDPDDLRKNLPNMWFDINNLIMQTRQIWIPNVLPVLQRSLRYAREVYTDANGFRSQIYIYRRNRFFQLSETADEKGTCLLPALMLRSPGNWSQTYSFTGLPASSDDPDRPVDNVTNQWSVFKSMVQNMINQLVVSQDRGMIYGDILKAYGEEKIYAMSEMAVDYTVFPAYNSEELMQIENIEMSYNYDPMGWFQVPDLGEGNRINPGFFNLTDRITTGAPDLHVLNMHFEGQASPEAVMVATRMKAGSLIKNDVRQQNYATITNTNGVYDAGKVNLTIGNLPLPYTAGTEVIRAIFLFTYEGGSPANLTNLDDLSVIQQTNQPATFWGSNLYRLMAFDWHPFLYNTLANTPSEVGGHYNYYIESYGDFDNYTTLTDDNLKKMHDVALFSLFGIPQLG